MATYEPLGGKLMKLLIVMLARNEERTVGTVIARLKALVPDADILVVNDASWTEPLK